MLSTAQFIARSLKFYWRTHVGVLLGVTVATAVLTGALFVGDSVEHSLRSIALARLGETRFAMDTGNRFFSVGLAADLANELQVEVAPVLRVRGVAIRRSANPDSDDRQVNNVRVLGVDERFWDLAPDPGPRWNRTGVTLNERLAAGLGVGPGDSISIRVNRPSLLPKDAPLAARTEPDFRRASLAVEAIVPDSHLGRFSLEANQLPPHNAFVDLAWLQGRIDLDARANLLLVGGRGPGGPDLGAAQRALDKVWRPEHAGITVRSFDRFGVSLLESDRVFLDLGVAESALAVPGAVGCLTYLVNSISKGVGANARSTPYSFMTACAPAANRQLSLIPPEMKDDEILVNRWVADELSLKPGDSLTVAYYELGPANRYLERTRDFTVREIVAMDELGAERALMPEFPGLSDVETCRDWDVGLPLEEEKLADAANEAYWNRYRDTPKALITLAAGQRMWANRFGSLTSVRYPLRGPSGKSLADTLDEAIAPEAAGFVMLPVRRQALQAVDEAMDFGGLFLGMSFFLIVAALMLTGLLFVFSVEQRAEEMGILLALGFRPARLRMLLLVEGGVIALFGVVAGTLLGSLYTRGLIWALGSHWQGAVAGSVIRYDADPSTALLGAAVGFLCAAATIAISVWRQSRESARELLSTAAAPMPGLRRGRIAAAAAVGCLAASVIIVASVLVAGSEHAVPAFFSSGSLLLLAGVLFSRSFLVRLERETSGTLSVFSLSVRNAARRPSRSLATIALLACGCFLVLAVSSMNEDLTADADKPWSGTGGFALFAESTLPVHEDLETAIRLAATQSDDGELPDSVGIVAVKVHDGDDASCFNLNRAQAPRLLGVDPSELSRRRAFLPRGASDSFWDLLEEDLGEGIVPGLAGDSDTAMWGLKKKVGREDGDTIAYRDERGSLFRVKLVGKLPMRLSVFQGAVLISADAFTRRFPSEAGHRMFLVEASSEAAPRVRELLRGKLARRGLDITTTTERLEVFYGVESTYLAMFLVLGGMGVALGSLGLGMVVLRNVLERRAELALLRAVGFSRARLCWLIFSEHAFLLVAGLVCGAASAAVAVLPALSAPGSGVSYGPLVAALAVTLGSGAAWTALAALLATSGDLVPALRNE